MLPVLSSTQGGELEYTRHRSPGAVCPTVASGSVALHSLKPALLPPFGTYSTKRNTHFLYFVLYFHSQPNLTSPFFSGVLHPWQLRADFPGPPFLNAPSVWPRSFTRLSGACHPPSPLQKCSFVFHPVTEIMSTFKQDRKEGKTKQRATEISLLMGKLAYFAMPSQHLCFLPRP